MSDKLFALFWYSLVGLGVTYLKMYAKKIKSIHSLCGAQSSVLSPSPPVFTIFGIPRQRLRRVWLVEGFRISRPHYAVFRVLSIVLGVLETDTRNGLGGT